MVKMLVEAAIEKVSPEGREVRRRQDPKMLNSAEVDAHNLMHLPYRCWCKHCVRGKAKDMGHMVSKGDAGEVPEVHFDFAFQVKKSQAVTLQSFWAACAIRG